jgi:hypothetical protein
MTVDGPTVGAELRSLTVQDADSYELHVGGSIYYVSTNQVASCEFTIDCPLEIRKWTGSDRALPTPANSLRRSTCQTTSSATGAVKLLSLFSIQHESYVYENFLILGMLDQRKRLYQRLGIGTGKIYSRDVAADATPVQSTASWTVIGNKGSYAGTKVSSTETLQVI